jgi:hypothetical protein
MNTAYNLAYKSGTPVGDGYPCFIRNADYKKGHPKVALYFDNK